MAKLIVLAIFILLTGACTARRSEPEKGVVTLEVGIDYRYGGVQPVARQEFFLLDSDITAGNELDEFNIDKSASPNLKLWALTAFVQGSGYEEQHPGTMCEMPTGSGYNLVAGNCHSFIAQTGAAS